MALVVIFGFERNFSRGIIFCDPYLRHVEAKRLGQAYGLTVARHKDFGGSEHGILLIVYMKTYLFYHQPGG